MSGNFEKTVQSVKIGNEILRMLDKADIHENIAQEALGNAWFRLCLSMRFNPTEFDDFLAGISCRYRKAWDKVKDASDL